MKKKPKCPECGSSRVWRDGLRYRSDGKKIQRYLCRKCGYRFSEPNVEVNVTAQTGKLFHPGANLAEQMVSSTKAPLKKSLDGPFLFGSENIRSHGSKPQHITKVGKGLNKFPHYTSDYRVSASEREAKNLVEVESQIKKWVAGTTKPDTATVKGYLTNFIAKQLLTGLKEKTIKDRFNMLRLLHKRGANLFDPESVFKAIDHAKKFNRATKSLREEEWQDVTKDRVAQAYKAFCKTFNITIPPEINFNKWQQTTRKLPWIPLEREVDQLIAGCGRKTACFLQLLKETGARSGEAWSLKWTDIDMERRIITINKPEKKGMPRQFKVSNKLIAMLNLLPKKSEKVFGDAQLNPFSKNFNLQRKRIAHKLQNPRINRITFHTLRHFYATMEYHRTKNIVHVKERLGHRNIMNTMIYTHLVNFEDNEFHVAHAKNLQKEDELIKAGFEFVRFSEQYEVAIYRKRK